jgi:hypothetical protein
MNAGQVDTTIAMITPFRAHWTVLDSTKYASSPALVWIETILVRRRLRASKADLLSPT